MSLLVLFLIMHGILGGADVIVNHEMIVGLPKRPGHKAEQIMHSAREAIFAALFLAIAWGRWQGAWAAVPAGLLLAELLVSLRDVAIEGETRILPVTEATLHVGLFVSLGILFAFGGLQIAEWMRLPTTVAPARLGWPAPVLTVMGLLAAAWSVRDAISARRERRSAQRYSARTGAQSLH